SCCFIFQAEDGIRDFHVTGVQTCALPISTAPVTGATCLYVVYDPSTGGCTLARTGHPPPVVVTPDGRADLVDMPGGPPLGLGGLPVETASLQLPPGSCLALYTDGLVDGRDHD